jgi:hypothetical protein
MKVIVAMESQWLQYCHWLLWKINDCHGKTLVAMEWSLKRFMVAMETQWLLCKSLVSMGSHWLIGSHWWLWKITGCYENLCC